MKRLFNHSKRSYEEENPLWDDFEYMEEYEEEDAEAGEVYEGEETSTVYSDEEYAEGEEYYESEEYADGEEYLEAEEYADGEEYYESEEYADGEEYFEAEEYAGEEEYYEDEDVEYMDEEEESDEDEEILPWSAMPDKNIFQKLWYSLLHMSTMDRIVTTTGVLVLVLALVTGAVYASARVLDSQVASFDTVGNQLDGITLVGEQGLLAVSDAEQARIAAANAIEDEEKEYEEEEYTKEVTVALNMTSIEKDLKLKFVNSKTNKLIANVPFAVTVKTPGGKTETWTDDDMDGIIYKTGITPGEYSVAMVELTDSKYEDYLITTESKKVTVKKEIAYQKVDVADEVKNESEIDSKKEDTKENETEVESTLTDTVSWVESTKTVVDSVYTAVAKSTVPDPLATAKSKQFLRTAAVTVNGPATLTVGETGTVSVTQPEGVTFSNAQFTSSNPEFVTVDAATGAVKAIAAGTATISFSATGTSTVSGDPEETYTGSCTIEVKEQAPVVVPVTGITLDKTTLSLEKGKTGALAATVAPTDATDKTVSWSSSDETVATVDAQGNITALKAGTATITAASKADQNVKATCTVTVTEAVDTRTVALDKTVLTLLPNTTQTITATIGNTASGGSTTGVLTVASDNKAVADATIVNNNGKGTITITAKAAGTAKITVAIEGTNISQVCTVTVGDRSITLDKATLSVLSGASKELTAVVNSTGGTVTVETSDSKIATAKVTSTAAADGKITSKIAITGVAAGSATITVVYTENGTAVKKTCTVTVVNKDTKLLTTDKKQLYVLVSDNNYREATYADYYNTAITTFYLKTDGVVKYTGWQTLDGKLYYFDASGKKVTGEQVIQGAKYNFASDGSLVVGSGAFGIDVSKWNGTIDWNAVRNSGVNYVIIRCGYRGSSTGVLVEDPKFRANIKGATAAGIKVGVYFFSQAVNKNEAVEEASMVLGLIKDYKISYPVFLDVEASGGRADGIDKATRTDVIKAFCETIQNSGYTAGVYANKSWLTSKIDAGALGRYKIWLAQYASAPTYTGRYDMWQYKSTGRVSGISGNVDLNLSYLGY